MCLHCQFLWGHFRRCHFVCSAIVLPIPLLSQDSINGVNPPKKHRCIHGNELISLHAAILVSFMTETSASAVGLWTLGLALPSRELGVRLAWNHADKKIRLLFKKVLHHPKMRPTQSTGHNWCKHTPSFCVHQ